MRRLTHQPHPCGWTLVAIALAIAMSVLGTAQASVPATDLLGQDLVAFAVVPSPATTKLVVLASSTADNSIMALDSAAIIAFAGNVLSANGTTLGVEARRGNVPVVDNAVAATIDDNLVAQIYPNPFNIGTPNKNSTATTISGDALATNTGAGNVLKLPQAGLSDLNMATTDGGVPAKNYPNPFN